MTFASSIADDCLIFDFTTTVTLEPDERALWSESVANATQTRLSKEQAAAIGPAMFETEHKRFGLYVAYLNSRVPEQGYYITVGSVVWQILSADLSTCGTRYVCACVKTRLTPTGSTTISDVLVDTEGDGKALQDTEGDGTILTDSEA